MIDQIIEGRSRGNQTIATTTRTKLMLKGVHPDRFTTDTPDDPAVISKLQQIAGDFGVRVDA
jgi:hypothetical protein